MVSLIASIRKLQASRHLVTTDIKVTTANQEEMEDGQEAKMEAGQEATLFLPAEDGGQGGRRHKRSSREDRGHSKLNPVP